MPTAALRLGSSHQQARSDRRNRHERGYDVLWEKLRAWFVVQPGNQLCRRCAARGVTTAVQEVDHVIPINRGGARLDPANLQSLCRSCHRSKTLADKARECR